MGCSCSSGAHSSSKPYTTTDINKQTQSLTSLDSFDIPADVSHLNAEDFVVNSYVAEGGMGVVYSAYRKQDKSKVALKFFGYNEHHVSVSDICGEIKLLQNVSGIEGVVQLYGVFMDSIHGYAQFKLDHKAYPVICMELLEGGDMFEWIHCRKRVSEKYLGTIFKSVILALQGIHSRRLLHRDLKPENLMLVSENDDSAVKIIDFGLMVELPEGKQVYTSVDVMGTRGYVAPESISRSEYSVKSDVWQAGCTLYSLLSGKAAFSHHLSQTTSGKYYPMTGVAWNGISEEAKDLVSNMLRQDPSCRFSTQQVLDHPWMRNQVSDENMDDLYYRRIKTLALRQKLKAFFQKKGVFEENKILKEKLRGALPFLNPKNKIETIPHRETMSRIEIHPSIQLLRKPVRCHTDSKILYDNNSNSTTTCLDEEEFDEKMCTLRNVMIESLSGGKLHADSDGENKSIPSSLQDNTSSVVCIGSSVANETDSSAVGSEHDYQMLSKEPTIIPPPQEREITFPSFVAIMLQCDLPELATPEVFRIFDISKTGTIRLQDFLLTMVALRESTACPEDIDDTDANIRLYFDLFDVDDNGTISVNDLMLALECLFRSDNSTTNQCIAHDVNSLFETMDIHQSGQVDFNEFKEFYEAVLVNSSGSN
mmetsp:Transcript_2935/g.4448  ORF Transcript_2935/g.4448 Transcript_2935/m.4448 type:complete len:650 (+) Transcript_2935:131-2080(+)